jgi:sigma-B regulation protein RsbU (phosphoserine phosphatase)
MAVTRTLLRAAALRGAKPNECLTEVNRALLRDSDSSLFVTLFYAVFDPSTGRLTYSNGGHNPPYVLRAGGAIEPLPGHGFPVGTLEEAGYRNGEARLRPGDVLFLYTDGVTEAMDAKRKLFTPEGLQQILEQGDRSTPAALVRDVLEAVRRFTGGAPQSDDLTALAMRYAGPG